MERIKSILVPTDFSVYSQGAQRYACRLARMEEASLTLLHVWHFPAYLFPDGFAVPGQDVRASILNRLEASLAEAKQEVQASGVSKFDCALVEGTHFVEIVKFARKGDFDLIVMGTHGYTGIKHALLGSVAEKVLRKAPCSVLTVRHPDTGFEHP